jgi:hypothetical protein
MNMISKKTVTILAGAALIGASLASAPASAKGWKGGGYHSGHGGAIAAGVFGALALGAIAASAANAAPSECFLEKRPTYNAYGDFVGYRTIRVCN